MGGREVSRPYHSLSDVGKPNFPQNFAKINKNMRFWRSFDWIDAFYLYLCEAYMI